MTREPAGLGDRGRAFWDEITRAFRLSPPERELVLKVCRTLDVVERLAEETDRASLMEVRQQRLVLGRLIAQLQIPDSDLAEAPLSRRGRVAAEKRWGHGPARKEGA